MRQTILLCFCLILFGIVILSCGRPEIAAPAEKPSAGDTTAVPDSDFPDTFREAREREDFVVLGNDNQLLREELWEAFLDAAARGEDAQVTVVRATIEGDPIYYRLTYRDNRYNLFADYNHDRWGGGQAETEYTYLERLDSGRSVDYILTNKPFGSDEAYAEYWDRVRNQTDTPDLTFEILINLEKDDWDEDPVPLHFEAQIIRTDGSHDGVRYPVVTVIDSADGLSRYYEEYKSLYDFSHRDTVYADTTIGLIDAIGKYDAAWFEGHKLLVVLCEEGSGSIRHEVTSVTGGSAPAVEITRLCPECCTDDMAEWHILIELERGADLSGEIAVRFGQKDV